jgi:hypothetical protein
MQQSYHWQDKQDANDKNNCETCHKKCLLNSLVNVFVKFGVSHFENFLFVSEEHFKYPVRLEESQAQSGHLRNQVHQEEVVVSDSHTIIDPWAMMVVSVNACVANYTMS